MDAKQAIADLTEISPQVRDVVVIGADGSVIGMNTEPGRAQAVADTARRLLAAADETRSAHGTGATGQLEVAATTGSVFVIRDGGRVIAATTTPEPTVGLVFYDLKTCLRSIDEPKPKRKTKKQDDAAA